MPALTPSLMPQELRKSGVSNGRVFLADVEFKEAKELFHRLGVVSLPWIMHISPTVNVGADGVIKTKPDDVVSDPSWCYWCCCPPHAHLQ